MFNEFSRAHAIRVMEKLIEYPSAKRFLCPVDPIKEGAYDYYDVIKKPADITSILNKLLNDNYQTMFDWRNDIHQIGVNAKLYNGENSCISILSDELIKHFEKLFKSFFIYDSRIWRHEYSRISSQLGSMIEKGLPTPKRSDFTSTMTLRHEVQHVFDANNSYNSDSKDQDYLDYDSFIGDDYIPPESYTKRGNQFKSDDTFVPQESASKSKSKNKHHSHSKSKSNNETSQIRIQKVPQKTEDVSPPEQLSGEKPVPISMPIQFGFNSTAIHYGEINTKSIARNEIIQNRNENKSIFGNLDTMPLPMSFNPLQSNSNSFIIDPLSNQNGHYPINQQSKSDCFMNPSNSSYRNQYQNTQCSAYNDQKTNDDDYIIDVTDFF